jgi:hypothetical protein
MSMNPIARKLDDETRKLIDEWLKTNKATQFEKYKRSEEIEYTSGFYGRKKKKKEE